MNHDNGQALATRTATPTALTLQDVTTIAKLFIDSKMFKDVRDVAQAAVKIMAGQELGFGPFASMSGIHIIQGKAEPGANLLAVMVKRSEKYDFRVTTLTNDRCDIEFTQDSEVIGVSTFTIDDAKKAGTQNTAKFPRNMLFARAISNGVKWFCPDVENGVAVYAQGEIMPDELLSTCQPIPVQCEVEISPASDQPSPPLPEQPPPLDRTNLPKVEAEQAQRIEMLVSQLQITAEAFGDRLHNLYRERNLSQLTPEEASDLESKLEAAFRKRTTTVTPSEQ